MSEPCSPIRNRRWTFLQSLAALLLSAIAAPAQAALADTVTVMLTAPGGTTADPLPVFASSPAPLATGIMPGDGSDVGNWLLPSEWVSFDAPGEAILLHIAGGGTDAFNRQITGYLGLGAEHARYEFTGLAVPAGFLISGFSATVSGLLAPATSTDFIHLLSPSSLSVDLDSLVFSPVSGGESLAGADLRINLLSVPVPEPASWALMIAGMAAVPGLRRIASRQGRSQQRG
jgi:hypothetical protein